MVLLEALPSADDSGEAEAEASSGEDAPTVVKEGGKALTVLSNERSFCRSVEAQACPSATIAGGDTTSERCGKLTVVLRLSQKVVRWVESGAKVLHSGRRDGLSLVRGGRSERI